MSHLPDHSGIRLVRESAGDHLRNALQLLEMVAHAQGEWGAVLDITSAAGERIRKALEQMEPRPAA